MCLHHIVAQGFSVRISLHLHAIHDVLCARSWECTNVCQLKRHSTTSPVNEKTDRATTPMMESGGLTRWTSTQSQLATCPSTANLLQQVVSEAGTRNHSWFGCRRIGCKSRRLAECRFEPSKGSVKGQQYVGAGGEKIDNLEELTVKSSHWTTRWVLHLETSDIPRSQAPQAFACSVTSDWQS